MDRYLLLHPCSGSFAIWEAGAIRQAHDRLPALNSQAPEAVKGLRIWSASLGLYSATWLKINNLKIRKYFLDGFL
jgi:hypothetical protein